jgi:3-methyl-2-oxobutanoate hydroxymethyltransferase
MGEDNQKPHELVKRFTLSDLRLARQSGARVPMLTCYDYTMARLMQRAGVPMLLVGDSAASVILGYDSTLPVSLPFMIQITAAVRRGAPLAMVMADMPFGSYQASLGQAIRNVCRMVKLSGCDCVKLEVAASHLPLVRKLSDAGVAVVAHLGLRPQAVRLLGGHKIQGKTAQQASQILTLAAQMESAGAASILLEAVPPEVAQAVVAQCRVPVIGCGAGHACHASVVVVHDALGLTPRRPRFVPDLGDLAGPLVDRFASYVSLVSSGRYPSSEQEYAMDEPERTQFVAGQS